MKTREQRRRVAVPARMQSGGQWRDACILNISSRGLLLHASTPPSVGSYLEIRRGQHVMVARVVWNEQDRFGVRTQDPLPVEAIVRDLPSAVSSETDRTDFVERRRHARHSHDRSRLRGRWIEYGAFALGGMLAATSVFGLLSATLARPMEQLALVLR